MSTASVIVIAVAILSFLGTHTVAYMHRKQMRQNELFRIDPKVGLKPPPSPPVKFFHRHLLIILDIIQIGCLSYGLWVSAQRPESLLMLVIAALVVFYVETIKGLIRRIRRGTSDHDDARFAGMENLPDHVHKIASGLIDIDSKQTKAIEEHSKALLTLFELIGDLRKGLPPPT
jgi:hypothetical protein